MGCPKEIQGSIAKQRWRSNANQKSKMHDIDWLKVKLNIIYIFVDMRRKSQTFKSCCD